MTAIRSRRRKLPSHPYPGLRPFTAEENLIFFGREGQTDELIDRLGKGHFLAVLGSSGSGKSSLVLAGLLPALQGGLMSGAKSHWKFAVIRPGDRPIARLTEALSPLVADPDDAAFELIPPRIMLETMLNASSHGLREAAMGPILRDNENLLVVVDQFEELFRFQEEDNPVQLNEARAFVRLLLEASMDASLPVYVVITMRSDFLGECPRFRDLPEAINAGQYLIPRLTRAQMRESIIGPAAVFNESLAPELVVRILNDVGDNPDQLPILQHALMRTWDHHKMGEEITQAHYEAIGGLSNALNQHAEEIFAGMRERGLDEVTEALFRCLTQLESESKGIRRSCRLEEVCASTGAEESKVIAVVEAFRAPGRSFLMPPFPAPLTHDSILDISHESFMRLWLRLSEWVRLEAVSATQYRRISAAARDYHQGVVNLWRQPELGIALKWRESAKPNAAWANRYDTNFALAMTFLDSSLAAWTHEEEEKAAVVEIQRNSEEQKRRVRRLFYLLGIMAVVLSSMIFLATYAFHKRTDALAHAEEARRQTAIAEAQTNVVEQQKAELEDKKKQLESQLLENIRLRHLDSLSNIAIQTLTKESLKAALEARDSIGKLLAKSERQNRDIEENGKVLEAKNQDLDRYSKFQKILLDSAGRKNGMLEALQLAERSEESPNPDSAAYKAIKAFQQYVKNGGNPNDPKLYNALVSAARRFSPMVSKNLGFIPIAFDYDPINKKANYILVSGKLIHEGEKVSVTDGNGGAPLSGRLLARGKDISRIIVADDASHLLLYDAEGLRVIREFVCHRSPIAAAVEVPGLNCLLSGDIAGNLFESSLADKGSSTLLFANSTGGISSMALSPKGNLVAVGTSTSIVFAELPGFRILRSVMIGNPITTMAFDQSGEKLVFGTDNGGVGYCDPDDGPATIDNVHASRVSAVKFSPDWRLLASCSYDKTIRLWRTDRLNDPPLVMKGHTSWVTGIGFRADSRLLYSVSKDKTMRYWFTDPETLAEMLEDPIKNLVQKGGEK